jgi:hypothetical protein
MGARQLNKDNYIMEKNYRFYTVYLDWAIRSSGISSSYNGLRFPTTNTGFMMTELTPYSYNHRMVKYYQKNKSINGPTLDKMIVFEK